MRWLEMLDEWWDEGEGMSRATVLGALWGRLRSEDNNSITFTKCSPDIHSKVLNIEQRHSHTLLFHSREQRHTWPGNMRKPLGYEEIRLEGKFIVNASETCNGKARRDERAQNYVRLRPAVCSSLDSILPVDWRHHIVIGFAVADRGRFTDSQAVCGDTTSLTFAVQSRPLEKLVIASMRLNTPLLAAF